MLELYGTSTKQRSQRASHTSSLKYALIAKAHRMDSSHDSVPQKEYSESSLVWEEQMKKLHSALPFLIWGTILQAEAGLTLATWR